MAISVELQEESYKTLIRTYSNRLKEEQYKILDEIVKLAAAEDIHLCRQEKLLLNEIISDIVKANKDAKAIYDNFKKKYDNLSLVNQKIHQTRRGYSNLPLHLRWNQDRELLQDHDMTLLMPNSTETITILAPVDTAQIQTLEAIQIGIQKALEDKSIQHIFMAIGPGHWRGFYLTKLSAESATYELELFDSFGPNGAKYIENFVFSKLLQPLNIQKNQVQISHTGPKVIQKDCYSCGDFVIAHTHEKMRDKGAAESDYNASFIEAIKTSNQLRAVTIKETKQLQSSESKASSSESADSEDAVNSYAEILSSFFVEKPLPPIKKPQAPSKPKSASKDRGWISLFGVAGSALMCALIGAIIGASLFPGIGVLFGALIGVAVGVLAGLAIIGVTRLLSKSTKKQQTGITKEDLEVLNTDPRPHSKSLKDELKTSRSYGSNAEEPKPNQLNFRRLGKGPTVEQTPAIPAKAPQPSSSPQPPAGP